MRPLLLLLPVLLGAGEPATVLVTAFEPFAGRTRNGSATVAAALPAAGSAEARIVVVRLPVTWDAPARLATLVAEHRPRLILGLGEGHPGRIAWERIARNRADGADERGAPPPAATLSADGPTERRGTLQCDPAWFPDATVPIVASDDAGAYLCNALYWHATALDAPRVGFLHLPPQGATADDAYRAAIVPVVAEIIRRNLVP